MARETEALIRQARATGTLGHQCEHLDFGSCFKCRGRVVAVAQETYRPFEVLKMLKDPRTPAIDPSGLIAPFPKFTIHGAR